MSLFSIVGIVVGFVALGLFVALRLCASDKAEPEARERQPSSELRGEQRA